MRRLSGRSGLKCGVAVRVGGPGSCRWRGRSGFDCTWDGDLRGFIRKQLERRGIGRVVVGNSREALSKLTLQGGSTHF